MNLLKIKIKDGVLLKNGYAFKSKDYKQSGIPLIRIGNIENNELVINEGTVYLPFEYLENHESYSIRENDILIALSGATVGKFGINTLNQSLLLNQRIGLIREKDNELLLSKYFYYLLNQLVSEIRYSSRGGAQPNISLKEIGEKEISIPPIAHQKEIITQFEKIQSLLKKRERTIKLLNEYLLSYFIEISGDPILNTLDFPIHKISDLKSEAPYSIKAGPFGSALKKSFYVSEGYKVYGQEQVVKGVDYGDYYINQDKFNELISCEVKSGDVLITLMGVVGKTAVIPEEFEAGIINPRLMKISFDQNKIIPMFFSYMFESPPIKSKILHSSRGIAMKGLNLGIVKNIEVVVPPLEIQKDFIEKKKKVDYQKSQFEKSKELFEELFQSLIYKTFSPQEDIQKKDEISELLDDNIQLEIFLNTINASDFQSIDQYNIEVEKLFKILKRTESTVKENEDYRKGITQLIKGKKVELLARKDYLNEITNETKES